MNHIFKPGDFAYWYEPSYVKSEWVELIANENKNEWVELIADKKDVLNNRDIFPLMGTFPITKPMAERKYVLFTLDGRIDPLSPPVLFVNNPFDENDVNNPPSYTDECIEEKDADYFLNKAVEILKERGRERDVEKERSMARIVSVYNALTGQSMSVEDGWKFMAILKLVRIQIKPHEDGFLDALSYIALWGEEFFNNETTKGD